MYLFNYKITDQVMDQAVRKYIDDEYSYESISASMNGVFEVKSKDKNFILRFSHPLKNVDHIHGEIDFINYLGRNKVNVVKPLLSKGNSYVEHIDDQGNYIVCAFEKAIGKMVDYRDKSEWNTDLFREWGKAIGRMHSLTKVYTPERDEYRRMEWNQESISVEKSIFNRDLVVPKGNEIVFRKWTELLQELNTFPKSRDGYGLVHCDLHSLNFFICKDGMTIFDFDDCCYHWFSYDIAIAFYDSLYSIPFEDKELRKAFIKSFSQNFFVGYNTENHLSDEWISRIPLFIKYRDFLIYLVTITHMNINRMDMEQRGMLHNIRCALENDIPYVELI